MIVLPAREQKAVLLPEKLPDASAVLRYRKSGRCDCDSSVLSKSFLVYIFAVQRNQHTKILQNH